MRGSPRETLLPLDPPGASSSDGPYHFCIGGAWPLAFRRDSKMTITTQFSGAFSRWLGLVAGVSLLVGLFAIASAPARAADPAPDYLPSFDACPGNVIPTTGFADVTPQHPNAAAVDCIAYYGITKGTSPTTFSPAGPVIRQHMALFLVRLAKMVGIDVPPARDTPYEDTAGLSERTQEAISQMYQMGIADGAAPTTYAPNRKVSRGEMAVSLARLMDMMIPVSDGRVPYGYLPDDVNDNRNHYDVASPFRDLETVTHTVHEAVTHLYELGVASGLSSSLYGVDADMSRSAMAEFMAAILDHSNLRPRGMLVQVTPTEGSEDFEIVMMISIRTDGFAPAEEVVVDWFYTADPDGGLKKDGTCDQRLVLVGDCIWDDDTDDETDLDGNIFHDFDATPGATMSVYAWTGRRDQDRFNVNDVAFSKAQAKSEKQADSLLVHHDVPVGAARISGHGPFIVDLDRRASVEFTIQLLDEDGARLEKEGVEIEIEVESREVRVDADDVTGGLPDPDLLGIGRPISDDAIELTDRRGRATFVLNRPSRNERLDTVRIESECCTGESYQIAWSEGDPVLVSCQARLPAVSKERQTQD